MIKPVSSARHVSLSLWLRRPDGCGAPWLPVRHRRPGPRARQEVVKVRVGRAGDDLITADLVAADLITAALIAADLVAADLIAAALIAADLVTAALITADLITAALIAADLITADLVTADLIR